MTDPQEQEPETPANIVDYRSTPVPGLQIASFPGWSWAKFFAGILVGFAITGLFIVALSLYNRHSGGTIMCMWPLVMALVGLVLLHSRRWAPMGFGVIATIALAMLLAGVLIFFAGPSFWG